MRNFCVGLRFSAMLHVEQHIHGNEVRSAGEGLGRWRRTAGDSGLGDPPRLSKGMEVRAPPSLSVSGHYVSLAMSPSPKVLISMPPKSWTSDELDTPGPS